MKKTSIIGMLSLALLTGVSTTSCEDMLEVESGDKLYVNANDTLYSYLGIVRCMQDVAERQVILGEIRGDLLGATEYTTDTLFAISNFDNPQDGSCSMLQISDYYNIINNCNFYIANADTAAIKANVQYMMPEYAQVQSIRAWAYLQLVKNYGEVPFITEPVHSLDVIKNFDYKGNLVDKNTLVDRIVAEGLDKYVDMRYPNYDKYGTGAVDISARLLFIPVRLVLGDLYLLRGNGESDYRKAAKYYYEYLKTTSSTVRQNYAIASPSRVGDGDNNYQVTGQGLLNFTNTYSYSANNEVISVIPSSANKGFGTMLTRVADIMGYTPKSSQDSEVESDEETGDESVSTSGSITVTPTYKRQYSPTAAYVSLGYEQTYVNYEKSGSSDPVRIDFLCGDARSSVYTTAGNLSYEGNPFMLTKKAASGNTFNYIIPIYRVTLVWLRLAEAINRAGYPEFAFAILKDGLSSYTLPDVVTQINRNLVVDENGEPLLDEDGKKVYVEDTLRIIQTNPEGALYYVTDTLRLQSFNQFLDFNDDVWVKNYGIHARGCGFMAQVGTSSFSTWDTQYASTNITGYRDSISYDYYRLIGLQLADVETPTLADTINAIENVIVDELALETAFEGNRFTDLVRIAEHKNESGHNGTEWLANKIARRGGLPGSIDNTVKVEERDEALYSKLLDKNLWYFEVPEWTTK